MRRRTSSGGRTPVRVALAATRIALPVALVLVGIAAIVIGHAKTPLAGGGVVVLGAAVIVLMINWLFRMSLQSNRDREDDERARDYFSEHGRWPGE